MIAESQSWQDWLAGGRRVRLGVPSGDHELFCRRDGATGLPSVTLLHGFPTSSWDWAPIWPTLAARTQPLAFDFLGFGDSDKPAGHDYSIHEQADLCEAVWRHHEVRETHVVAHDYAVSVAQELLARHAEGRLTTKLLSLTLLNGGLWPDLHRPLLVQQLLRNRVVGPLVTRLVSQRLMVKSLRSVLGPHAPPDEELAAHWETITRRGGHRLYHRLIRYMDDRLQHQRRWVGALESTTVPLGFVWGMLDPISGAHVAKRIAERLPHARRLFLDDVGHYPQLEAPERVLAALP